MECRPLRFQHKRYFEVPAACDNLCAYWKICVRCKEIFDEEERDRIEAGYDEKQFIGTKRVRIRRPGIRKVWAENRRKYLPRVKRMLGKYKQREIAERLGISYDLVKNYILYIRGKK